MMKIFEAEHFSFYDIFGFLGRNTLIRRIFLHTKLYWHKMVTKSGKKKYVGKKNIPLPTKEIE